MGSVLLEQPERHFACPSCGITHVDRRNVHDVPMHPCPALKGILAPLVQVHGQAQGLARGSVRHVVVERGDRIGDEKGVVLDGDGMAVQAVRTERADGTNDCHVFAPVATADAKEIR